MARLLAAAYRFAPALGGAENHARRLYREIGQRLDIDIVTMLTSNGDTRWLRLLIDGERQEDHRYHVDGRTVTALGRWPRGERLKLRLLAPGYHLPRSPVPALMAGLLTPRVAPHVAGADLVHCPFMGREAFSLAFLLAARRAGIPFVFTPLRHRRPLGWSSPAFRQLYAQSDAVIALTEHEATWLERRGARRPRLHVIGIGPMNDPEAPAEPAWEALGDRTPFVLFLGQLHRYKGFHALLDAARRLAHADVRFVVAGPDVRGARRSLEAAPANVRYLGQVDDRLRDSLLRACRVLCVPSSRESFGGVLVEAWSAGRPVIGGPAPATREVVEDGVDGWSAPQDGRAVADRISRLLADPALADRMGACGRRKVARRWSWSRIADAHMAIYERLLGSGEG